MSSSLDSIYKKLAASLEQDGGGHPHEAKFDPARQISPTVAHELNNLLTIIQGYADRLLVKQGGNPALEAQLKLIADAARRATNVIQGAAASATASPSPQNPQTPQAVAA